MCLNKEDEEVNINTKTLTRASWQDWFLWVRGLQEQVEESAASNKLLHLSVDALLSESRLCDQLFTFWRGWWRYHNTSLWDFSYSKAMKLLICMLYLEVSMRTGSSLQKDLSELHHQAVVKSSGDGERRKGGDILHLTHWLQGAGRHWWAETQGMEVNVCVRGRVCARGYMCTYLEYACTQPCWVGCMVLVGDLGKWAGKKREAKPVHESTGESREMLFWNKLHPLCTKNMQAWSNLSVRITFEVNSTSEQRTPGSDF